MPIQPQPLYKATGLPDHMATLVSPNGEPIAIFIDQEDAQYVADSLNTANANVAALCDVAVTVERMIQGGCLITMATLEEILAVINSAPARRVIKSAQEAN